MPSPMDIDKGSVPPQGNVLVHNDEDLSSPLLSSPPFVSCLNETTPVIGNSRASTQRLSVYELDRLQRQRREKTEEAKICEEVILDVLPPLIEPDDDTGENFEAVGNTLMFNRRRRAPPAPRLNFRPSATPVNNVAPEPVIIASGQEEKKDLGDLFPSPHSDRFVLRSPNGIILQGHEEAVEVLRKDFMPDQEGIELLENLEKRSSEGFDLVEIPSPISTSGSESPPLGTWMLGKKKISLKPKPSTKNCPSPKLSLSINTEEVDLFTSNDPSAPSDADVFQNENICASNTNGSFHNSNFTFTRNLKPKRPRIPSVGTKNHFGPEEVLGEGDDLFMDLDQSWRYSVENYDDTYSTPRHGSIGLISTPSRQQLHDRDSIERAKGAAALFGTRRRIGRNSSFGSAVVDASPSNMSESNFHTPIKEPTPGRYRNNMYGERAYCNFENDRERSLPLFPTSPGDYAGF